MAEINKNVIKKRKIINGVKFYELDINRDNYLINIINLPNELIKFTIYINKSNDNEINISSKIQYNIYENQFNLEYFINQTPLLKDLNINNINDLIRFLQSYFQEYKNELINIDKNNPHILNLKLQMFKNKIQINIQLYNNQIINKNKNDNINEVNLRASNSCKNLSVHKKELKIHTNNNKKIIAPNNNNSSLMMDYYISLIQKQIPLLKKLTKDKLILLYKSSKENNNFHLKCDNKGPTLVFIETEENRSFITFNKKSWHLEEEEKTNKYSWRETNIKDDDIAIIDLFTKKKIEIKKKKEDDGKHKFNSSMNFIQQYSNYGPSYVDGNGFNFKIFGEDKYLSISFITKNKEEEDYILNVYKLNKNNFLHIKDYEVYGFNRDEK